MPVICVANKIDMDPTRATKSFAFVEKQRQVRGGNEEDFPFYFVSASDGSNVVSIFRQAIERALLYKQDIEKGKGGTFVDEVLAFIKDEEKEGGLFHNGKGTLGIDAI
jgi:ribosome biogenesis GTPase A